MRPAWRLAINNLSERRSRTALLSATVALAAALIAAVSCAMASINLAIEMRLDATVGAADLRIRHVGGSSFSSEIVDQVRAWPEVSIAVARNQGPIALRNTRTGDELLLVGHGIDPAVEYTLRPVTALQGRLVESEDEIVLGSLAAEELGARIGDSLSVQRFGDPIELTVVGIVPPPPLGMWDRPEGYTSLDTLGRTLERRGRVREVDIVLRDGEDAESVAEARRGEMPRGLLLQATERITSGLNKNLQSSQIGFVISSALSFLAAAFIIMTGLTTNVQERQRELAILRCIGGTRAQLAEAQVVVGVAIAGLGAIVGVPLGVAAASALVMLFPEQLPGGFGVSPAGLAIAFGGSVLAGLAGAAFPALSASRTTPLGALASRARAPSRRGVIAAAVFGAAGALLHYLLLSVPEDGQVVFWGNVTLGLPAMFTGYFLLAVPAVLLVVAVFGPLIRRLLRLPPELLSRAVRATPFRHGFTAGAMMLGLALLVAIWTNGGAIMRDWLGSLEFPDAFVHGFNLTEETQARIESVPGVTQTCAITLQRLETDAFGIRALQRYKTTFVAFEPDRFFSMTRLTWVQGDRESALARLREGGAVLVAREFMVTQGIGVGDTITLRFEDSPYTFDVVGVVTSPGLDIVSKFFDIGEEYLEQSVNAVFGSRRDLIEKFDNDAINLIQIGLDPGYDDAAVMEEVVRAVGGGVIAAGSGRQIKEEIRVFISGTIFVFSTVAVAAMLVACLGVANLIIAGIHARQFEFGVLRAIGAQRGLLTRLVLGEAIIIALTACILGTLMGIQSSWAGQRLYEVLLGLVLNVRVPVWPTAVGWLVLTLITLGAAGPAVWRLSRKQPRELLAAMKG